MRPGRDGIFVRVLRLPQYLMRDPAGGDDKPFLCHDGGLVRQHENRPATRESFAAMASERFARMPLARRFGAARP